MPAEAWLHPTQKISVEMGQSRQLLSFDSLGIHRAKNMWAWTALGDDMMLSL